MGGSQQDLEEDARAAACVAADPVFSALDASGAPIVAAGGDPLRIAFLNESARAVFGEDAGALAERLFRGDDPGPRRLAELVGDMRRRPGLRLERLRFRVSRAGANGHFSLPQPRRGKRRLFRYRGAWRSRGFASSGTARG